MQKLAWEIEKSRRHTPWFVLGTIAFISFGVAVYFFSRNNLFAVTFFIIAPLVLIISATQGPKKLVYEISDKGITINGKLYKYNTLKYFSFVGEHLVVKPKNANALYIVVEPDMQEQIQQEVKEKLKEKEHEETLMDILNRVLEIH